MKYPCLLFCLTLLSFSGFAQKTTPDVDITRGRLNKHKYSERIFVHKPLGMVGGDYYFLATSEPNAYMHDVVDYQSGNTLGKMDKGMKTTYVPIETKEEKKDMVVEFATLLKGELYVFFSFQNMKQKKHFLFYRKYNKTTLLPEGKTQFLAEVDYANTDKFKTAWFEYRLSPDSSHILILGSLADKDGELVGMELLVLDHQMQKIWNTNTYRDKLPEGFVIITDYIISNRGEVHMLGLRYDSKREMKYASKIKRQSLTKRRLISYPVYDIVLVSFMDKTDKTKALTFELPNFFVRDLKLMPKGDTLLAAGIYSLEGTMSVLGTCLFTLDARSGQVLSRETHPFEKALIVEGASERMAARMKEDIKAREDFEKYHYELMPLIPDGQGGFWLLAEQGLTEYVTQKTGGMVTTSTIHTKDNVYVVRYEPDGTPAYAGKLLKHQQLTNCGNNWLSFKAHAYKDKLYIFYNMVTGKETSLFRAFKNFPTQLTIFDPSGNQESKVLFQSDQLEVDLVPRFAGMSEENSLVFFGPGKNMYQHRYVKVNL